MQWKYSLSGINFTYLCQHVKFKLWNQYFSRQPIKLHFAEWTCDFAAAFGTKRQSRTRCDVKDADVCATIRTFVWERREDWKDGRFWQIYAKRELKTNKHEFLDLETKAYILYLWRFFVWEIWDFSRTILAVPQERMNLKRSIFWCDNNAGSWHITLKLVKFTNFKTLFLVWQ